MTPVEVARGDGPLILGIPHAGTEVPDEIIGRLNGTGRTLADTDWHVDRLYDGLAPHATIVRATFHRYVIDANRDPAGASLYPGRNATSLCPLTDFHGRPIYAPGCEPDTAETACRLDAYHAPYHAALTAELYRVRERHGVAILHDCHSIRSELPWLFVGRLPDLNVGTDGGRTCAPRIAAAVMRACKHAEGYTSILDGRFRGGWTTRHYGRPADGWHAVQMELAQATYMDEAPPFAWVEERAARLRPVLARILTTLAEMAPSLGVPR